ncbi:MAG: DUF5060 domain-containing protein [Verrucomicrobia bacterium]|nr:DUF5060 domain-containing protein [Verrucomicrobiota bacterium]
MFLENNGLVAVEAEHFYKQTLTAKRAWQITSSDDIPNFDPDGDPAHLAGASGNAYLEILPDSRRNHSEKLIHGENFSNQPGKLGILHYKVQFANTGRYYVWVRAFSSGSEDNGIHVGLNGQWPATGQRMQWCQGKQAWRWESKQRTEEQHCGEPYKIYLDIEKPGIHDIMFSMREDGFEFDKFILTKNRDFTRPENPGPIPVVKSGKLPAAFAAVKETTGQIIKAKPQQVLKQPRQPDGDGSVSFSGELRQWHNVTLTLNGPFANEWDNQPNPFTDHRFNVRFTHASGSPDYLVPGYFAADGGAANSSANSGSHWRAHLSPDKTGKWAYTISFNTGSGAAIGESEGKPLKPFDGITGNFKVKRSNKKGQDFRAKGRLEYVDGHYLQFAGSKEYFLKAGPDAPETLLAYQDFDGTQPGRKRVARTGEAAPTQSLKTWEPHVQDWNDEDPTWKNGKGKGLIGALNYISSKGINSFSFLPYNAGGDGDNVWPFVERMDKLHYDVSKLAQWEVVFNHANNKGLHLHFKLQENEIDDNRRGHKMENSTIHESLDGGLLGVERKLYCRELIARFGHHLALNWNIGEENTQSVEEINAMVGYLREVDPYDHNVVIHTFPDQQDKVYTPLLGDKSLLTGASLQNSWNQAHQRTLKWRNESAKSGKPWIVVNDEQGPASMGVPPDPGYEGHSGEGVQNNKPYTMHDIRKNCLWGTLLAGGAGVEYYFGYQLPQNDLVCQDWRSRDKSWEYCQIALDFFKSSKVPFWEMSNANALIGNEKNTNDKYCYAKEGEVYLVYLTKGGTSDLDLTDAEGRLSVRWFNPRDGRKLLKGSVKRVNAGSKISIGNPPTDVNEDWLAVIRK